MIPTLRTARLTLRPFTVADSPRVKVLGGERAIADTTGSIPHPYEDGMAEAWIARQEAEHEAGTALQLAVTLTETGELLGNIGLVMSPPHRRAELGYWLGTPYWGRGYTTEAGEALVRHGFIELGLARIIAHHLRRNPASGRVLQKLGMCQEGLMRQHYLKWDTLEDIVLYGLLREEWEASEQSAGRAVVPSR